MAKNNTAKSADSVTHNKKSSLEGKVVANKFSIKPYLKQHKLGLGAYLFIVIIYMAIDIPLAIIPANLLLAVTQANYQLALKNIAFLGSLYLLNTILKSLMPVIYIRISTDISMAMSLDVAEQAFKISSSTYANHQTGSFMQRIRTDPDTIVSKLSNTIELFCSLASDIIICVYILTLNGWISLVLLVYFAIMVLITYYRRKVRIFNNRKMHKAGENVTSLLSEIVRSERDIKSLNLETNLKSITKNNFDEYKTTVINSEKNNSKYRLFDWLLFTIFIVALYTVGVFLLDKGLLTLATFLIIHNNRFKMDQVSNEVANIVTNMADVKIAYERINELYANENYELEKFGSVNRKKLGNDIEFKNVKFAYVDYKEFSAEEIIQKKKYNKKHKIKAPIPKREIVGTKQVFDDLSFKIEPNTTVAFVGKSGCGKSTVLNLISKLYTVDAGQVLIGGIDINKLDKQTLRSSISLVNQFPYIFDMTIKENLLLAKPNATDAELNSAIKESALDEFISGLTNGIDTQVGESGVKLSGGQKQRLAIARALLKNSRIIILDESTSSLDNLAQNTIKESIDKIKGKSTIIIVAHRLSTIKNVDKIFFMENGKIVDTGTFNELNKNNKAFKKMYNAESVEE